MLADPFSVALHAVTRNPPPPGGRAVVYGAGALGTTATAILRALYPDIEVATSPAGRRQADARRRSAPRSSTPSHAPTRSIEALAAWSGGDAAPRPGTGCRSRARARSTSSTTPSARPTTIEVGLRVLAQRGTIVQMGVVTGPLRVDALVLQGAAG